MAFFFKNDELHIGTQKLSNPVRRFLPNSWQRPVYVYDLDDIDLRFLALKKALLPVPHQIHYAMKANSNPKILARLANLGAGVDTVSLGEIKRALAAGFNANQIIFSGVAKTIHELEFALHQKIKQINIESIQELDRVAMLARAIGTCADIALRINPDVNPKTHPYITTGFRDNKFGMDESFVPEIIKKLNEHPGFLRLRGLTVHIGSLLFDLDIFHEAIEKALDIHKVFINHGFSPDRIDIGGGLGVRYETDECENEFTLIDAYGKMAVELLQPYFSAGHLKELLVEPGRILVARSGLLVSEVQYIKRTQSKNFVILDTGMHHLMRPALYQAKHRIIKLTETKARGQFKYDFVGPICESSDFLGRDVTTSEIKQGELIGLADSGAYGFAMASHYNSHDFPDEICVSGGTQV